MISGDWQNIAALALVALAALYLLNRARQLFFRRSAAGCSSGCVNCPTSAASSTATDSAAVVTMEQLMASAGNCRQSQDTPVRSPL